MELLHENVVWKLCAGVFHGNLRMGLSLGNFAWEFLQGNSAWRMLYTNFYMGNFA